MVVLCWQVVTVLFHVSAFVVVFQLNLKWKQEQTLTFLSETFFKRFLICGFLDSVTRKPNRLMLFPIRSWLSDDVHVLMKEESRLAVCACDLSYVRERKSDQSQRSYAAKNERRFCTHKYFSGISSDIMQLFPEAFCEILLELELHATTLKHCNAGFHYDSFGVGNEGFQNEVYTVCSAPCHWLLAVGLPCNETLFLATVTLAIVFFFEILATLRVNMIAQKEEKCNDTFVDVRARDICAQSSVWPPHASAQSHIEVARQRVSKKQQIEHNRCRLIASCRHYWHKNWRKNSSGRR